MAEYKKMTYKIGVCEFDDSYYETIDDILKVEIYATNVSDLNFYFSDVPKDSTFLIWINNVVKSQEIKSVEYNFLSIKFLENKPTIIFSLFKYFSDTFENWELKWDLRKFFDIVKSKICLFSDIILVSDDTSEDAIDYNIAIVGHEKLTIHEQYMLCVNAIDKIYRIAKLEIGGLEWKDIYSTSEKAFSIDIIEPLLRMMKFDSVRYVHGTKEFGKDFLCSYTDKFKVKRYIGIQVKAGNVSGKVNSQIDELFGQVEDAFSMPFKEIGDKADKYISSFFIIISGQFTENAKDKIAEKIPKNLIGHISFIDKYGILDLIENIKSQ